MNEDNKPLETRIDEFIGHLRQLAREGHEDRAALAALRSGLRGEVQNTAAMNPHVVPSLNEMPHHTDRWFYVVGALFAWHPQAASKRSLGASFRELKGQDGASQSVEARFAALLACNERDLHLHLRQAVGLLRAHDVPVDWKGLLTHLAKWGWNHPHRLVQEKWARDYYRKPYEAPEAQTPPTPDQSTL